MVIRKERMLMFIILRMRMFININDNAEWYSSYNDDENENNNV